MLYDESEGDGRVEDLTRHSGSVHKSLRGRKGEETASETQGVNEIEAEEEEDQEEEEEEVAKEVGRKGDK